MNKPVDSNDLMASQGKYQENYLQKDSDISGEEEISSLFLLKQKTAEIPVAEKQCTHALLAEWKNTLPLFQKKILINTHFTQATLLLVELFIFSGAEIKMTCTDDLVCHPSIKNIISMLGIYLSPEKVRSTNYIDYFDAVIDCGAYLANSLRPRKGFVELTHVEESRYINTKCPVISVDNSPIKWVETAFGTGDGFVRAIELLYSKKGDNYKHKSYLVFGYGKVGEGIVVSLNNAGVCKDKIIIVEINEKCRNAAEKNGFSAYSLYQDKEIIKKLLANSVNCAVTATGVEGSISQFLESSDFSNVEYLANMGTYDEWGKFFSAQLILNNKYPLNFMLNYPTKIFYLDPVFALLACVTLELINGKSRKKFYMQKPKLVTVKKVFDLWTKTNLHYKKVKQLWEKRIDYQAN
jgi:adenosylhomocysteinase